MSPVPGCQARRARQVRPTPLCHPHPTHLPTPNTRPRPERAGAGSGLSIRPRVPAGSSNLRPRQVPPHLVLPGRVAPQHLAPDRDFKGPVGQLRLRRLLLSPPAAHPPVAPPGPGQGRAGQAKRCRALGSRVTARRAAAATATESVVRFGSALRLPSLGQNAGSARSLAEPRPGAAEGGATQRSASSRRRTHAANPQPCSRPRESAAVPSAQALYA